MKFSKILAVYMTPVTKKQKDSFRKIRKILPDAVFTNRSNIQKKITGFDLVIVIGGDGTFLKASHFIHDKTPLLGINLDTSRKEGFFMSANDKDLQKKLKMLMDARVKKAKLHRIEAKIGKKSLGLALNDIYFGSPKAYQTSYYKLIVDKKEYLQKSSGVIISTAAGSYAWTKSAGGKQLNINSDKFQFVVRDPYSRRLTKVGVKQRILSKNSILRIKSLCNSNTVVLDSMGVEHKVNLGDTLTLKVATKPLFIIKF